MTTHQFAEYLLKVPDLPLKVEGAGADQGRSFDVGGVGRLGDSLLIGYFYFDTDKSWCYPNCPYQNP